MPRGEAIPAGAALELLDRVLEAVPAFLFGGTLLGAVREGTIIADDWDVDVALLAEDWREKYREQLPAIATERQWGRETAWADAYVDRRWHGCPSLLKIEDADGYHLDLHVLTPGTDPTWRYWQRGPGDDLLMRTPSALLEGRAPAVLDGRIIEVPAHAAALLTYCYGNWHAHIPAGDWYGSPTYERIWRWRAVRLDNLPYTARELK